MEIFIKKQRDGLFVAQFYYTQHSWTLNNYLGAFVNPDGTATPLFLGILPVFAAEWNVDVKAEFTSMKRRSGVLMAQKDMFRWKKPSRRSLLTAVALQDG